MALHLILYTSAWTFWTMELSDMNLVEELRSKVTFFIVPSFNATLNSKTLCKSEKLEVKLVNRSSNLLQAVSVIKYDIGDNFATVV